MAYKAMNSGFGVHSTDSPYVGGPGPTPSGGSGSTSGSSQVSFHQNKEAIKQEKQKYFTQKYGREQLSLIRKRLDVEDWIWDQLRIVYNCQSDADDHSCELDVDDLLDMDTEEERRVFLQKELADAKQSPEVIMAFVHELLQKLNTL